MPPVNDNYANATVLTGAPGTVTFDITGATRETSGGAAEYIPASGHTVWFKWVAPADGTIAFDTSQTPSPRWDSTLLAVTDGATWPDNVAITSRRIVEDDDGALQSGVTTADGFGTSKISFAVVAGTTYYIQADSYDYAADAGYPSTSGTNPSAGYPRTDCVLHWEYTSGGGGGGTPASPTVTGFTPSTGRVGDAVTIFGTSFTTATNVSICGKTAAFTIVSDTEITTHVPYGAAGADGLITVTNPTGTGSHSGFTPIYPGPWVQPPDGWGCNNGGATTYTVTTTGPTPPSLTGAAPDSVRGGGETFQGVTAQPTGFGGTFDHWQWSLVGGLIGAEIGNLDPVPPDPSILDRPHVYGYEYEGGATAGTALGPVTLSVVPVSDTNAEWEDDTAKTADPANEVMSVYAELRRIPAASYTILTPTIDFTSPGGVFPDPTFLNAAIMFHSWPMTRSAADITVTDSPVPAGDEHGTYTPDAVSRDLTLADLDAGTRIAFVICSDRDLTETRFSLPAATWPSFKTAELDFSRFLIELCAFYRPPRWRLFYDRPPVGLPPLRQYPRDDAVGGAPRQGHTNQGRSIQASPRQGWTNSYR